MDEAQLISLLIGDIYDAALDPALWPRVLAQSAAFVGGISASLYAKDAAAKRGNVFYEDGRIDRHYKKLYFTRYVKLDPSTTGHFFAEIDQPIATGDLIPYDEFLQTRFCKSSAENVPIRVRRAMVAPSTKRAWLRAVSGAGGHAHRASPILALSQRLPDGRDELSCRWVEPDLCKNVHVHSLVRRVSCGRAFL
jgi:hypothetical protein